MLRKIPLAASIAGLAILIHANMASAAGLNPASCLNPGVGAHNFTLLVDDVANIQTQFHDIQSAINSAQNGDIIGICPGTYEGFSINSKEVTLVGLGTAPSDVVLHQGVRSNGIATIENGSSATIQNLKFENGQSNYGGRAGALSIYESKVTISNSEFYGNKAVSGGAIQLIRGTVKIQSSIFEGNEVSDSGGAIYGGSGDTVSPTHIIIENSQFRTNTVKNRRGSFLGGGAITIVGDEDEDILTRKDTAFLDISGSEFNKNHSDGPGGAITIYVGHANIKDSKIMENGTKKTGGGIYLQASQLKLNGVQAEKNVAKETGGVIFMVANDGSLNEIKNSVFKSNKAKNGAKFGGSFMSYTNFTYPNMGRFTFSNTTIRNNTGENCLDVLGYARSLGRNHVDDVSCF